MFCPNCGTKNEDGARFCANCGKKLTFFQPENQETDNATQNVATPEAPVAQENTQQETTKEETTQEATPVNTQEATSNTDSQNTSQPDATPSGNTVDQAAPQVNNSATSSAAQQASVTPNPSAAQQASATPNQSAAQQNYSQPTQFNPQPASMYMPMAPKKKFPVAIIVAIVAVFVIIVGSVSGFLVVKNITDPKNVVKKYAKALTSHDSDALYDSLDFPESKYLTKDLFKQTLEGSNSFDYGEAVDYEINDSLSKYSSDSSKKVYTLELRNASHAFSDSQIITLTKMGTKSFIFFDNWKIDTDSFLVKDASIAIPVGTKATLDGIEISSDMLNKDADNSNGTYDVYTVKYMFGGKHTLKITSENFQDYEKSFTLDAANYKSSQVVSVASSDLQLSPDVEAKLGETSKTLFTNLYAAIVAKKPFSEAVTGVDVLSSSSADLENGYNSIISDYMNGDSPLKAVTVNTANASAQMAYSDDNSLAVRITLNVGYKADSTVKDIFSKKKEKKSYDGNDDYSFVYHYVDGKWQLYDSSAFKYCITYQRY